MKEFTTDFIAEKNALENGDPWVHLVELTVTANSIAYWTSHPDTVTWNSKTYNPAPLRISVEESHSDGTMPSLFVDVANVSGQAFKYAKDNDISMNNVWIRLINTGLTTSGSDARIKLQITGVGFNNEVARFALALPYNTDVYGPKRIFDRATFKCIPRGFRNYYLIS